MFLLIKSSENNNYGKNIILIKIYILYSQYIILP